MGLFSGSKKQESTSIQTSVQNNGQFAGLEGSVNNSTNLTEIDSGGVAASFSLAERAISAVTSIADRSQAINLATVDTLVAQGGGAAKVALESGIPFQEKDNTMLYLGIAAVGVFFLARS